MFGILDPRIPTFLNFNKKDIQLSVNKIISLLMLSLLINDSGALKSNLLPIYFNSLYEGNIKKYQSLILTQGVQKGVICAPGPDPPSLLALRGLNTSILIRMHNAFKSFKRILSNKSSKNCKIYDHRWLVLPKNPGPLIKKTKT